MYTSSQASSDQKTSQKKSTSRLQVNCWQSNGRTTNILWPLANTYDNLNLEKQPKPLMCNNRLSEFFNDLLNFFQTNTIKKNVELTFFAFEEPNKLLIVSIIWC